MKQHVIIEGCDGAGKDTLIGRIQSTKWGRQLAVHDRTSTSARGPVDFLARWVEDDNAFLHDPEHRWIYNRHPLISERIYAPFRKNKPISPGFEPGNVWHDIHLQKLAKYCLLVVVQPPFRVVEDIVRKQKANDQMPGVVENLRSIYARYQAIQWPGTMIRYNRIDHSSINLANQIRHNLGLDDE